MNDDDIETFNSSSINESMEAKRANCRKRLRTLENENEKSELAKKVLKSQLELEYSLIENLKEVDKNSKLSEQMEKLKNCEKTKIKEESELNKIKEDYKKLNNNLENIKKVIAQMKSEKLNLENDFNEEIETVQRKATDQLKKALIYNF
ncbi:unnamed protein product [Meloidogyne enterolobii]|uniref:Uncharacterized protein n=1 Tax=Meloidogyne enterolobii TaxID=390850 RepID=A0ACB0Z1N1_MELEN